MSPSQAPITPSISEILACYRGLSKMATLDPSPQVDALFGRLVYLCRQTPDNATAAKVSTYALSRHLYTARMLVCMTPTDTTTIPGLDFER